MIETLGGGHRGGQHLSCRVAIRGKIESEWIDALSLGPLPIFVEHILGAGEVQGGHRHENFGVVEVAVHQRTHHGLQWRYQHTDKCAAHYFRSEAHLVSGTDERYGVWRI